MNLNTGPVIQAPTLTKASPVLTFRKPEGYIKSRGGN
jgi:hypothetical protein